MTADDIGRLVDHGVSIAIGVFLLLIGFRRIGKKPGVNARADRFHERFGRVYRWLGAVFVAMGIMMAFVDRGPEAAAVGPASWRTYTSSRGDFAVDLPGAPREECSRAESPLGSIELHSTVFDLDQRVRYWIVQFDLPPGNDAVRSDQVLDRQSAALYESLSATELHQRRIAQGESEGRDLTLTLRDGSIVRARVFARDRTVWRVAATVAKSLAESELTTRFLSSFRLLGP